MSSQEKASAPSKIFLLFNSRLPIVFVRVGVCRVLQTKQKLTFKLPNLLDGSRLNYQSIYLLITSLPRIHPLQTIILPSQHSLYSSIPTYGLIRVVDSCWDASGPTNFHSWSSQKESWLIANQGWLKMGHFLHNIDFGHPCPRVTRDHKITANNLRQRWLLLTKILLATNEKNIFGRFDQEKYFGMNMQMIGPDRDGCWVLIMIMMPIANGRPGECHLRQKPCLEVLLRETVNIINDPTPRNIRPWIKDDLR